MGRLVDQKKAHNGILAFFPVVAISAKLSTNNSDAKEIKKINIKKLSPCKVSENIFKIVLLVIQ